MSAEYIIQISIRPRIVNSGSTKQLTITSFLRLWSLRIRKIYNNICQIKILVKYELNQNKIFLINKIANNNFHLNILATVDNIIANNEYWLNILAKSPCIGILLTVSVAKNNFPQGVHSMDLCTPCYSTISNYKVTNKISKYLLNGNL